MRPKDLKAQFNWKNRRVHLEDRVWHVPSHHDDYKAFTFNGWQDPLFFGNHNPVHVEYCSGHGDWVVEKARLFPCINWVAVELQFDRVRKIWSKMKNLSVQNLIIVCAEGENLTRQYFKESSIHAIYINFPDPWPKNKHAKHRLIKPSFVSEIHRVLVPEGKATAVTDDVDYSKIMIQEFLDDHGLISCFDFPYYTTDMEGYGYSLFESLWRKEGKPIRYHQFKKDTA